MSSELCKYLLIGFQSAGLKSAYSTQLLNPKMIHFDDGSTCAIVDKRKKKRGQ